MAEKGNFNDGSTDYKSLVDGASGKTQETTDNTTLAEEPIENKWNNLHGMFDVKDEPMRMNDDTPSVHIYISREKVWQKNKDGEYGWDGDTTPMSKELEAAYMDDDTVDSTNTSLVNKDGTQILASNAIPKSEYLDE